MSGPLAELTRISLAARALLVLLAVVVALTSWPTVSSAPPAGAEGEQAAAGAEVIVVLDEGEDPEEVAAELGVAPTHIYTEVFTGFAGTMPAATIAEARADRAVRRISADGRVQAEAQTIPTGITRVGLPVAPGTQNLDIASPIDADIAILDTGVTPRSDLNVAGGVNCVDRQVKNQKKAKKGKKGKTNKDKKKGKKLKPKDRKQKRRHKQQQRKENRAPNWHDDNGHGTHTAGIAAAFDNDDGVVGVAPGARIWAVKVLDASGGGTFSDVICGLDWVVANKDTIDVINMSLSGAGDDGGGCASSAFHQATCNVVFSGVPVMVAAGNQGTDAASRVPASFDEVITVSALADSDGTPGGASGPCFGEFDDTFASFSNFGADVDIMAPGICILSLSNQGGPIRESGTSEASPHVAGAAALFIAQEIAAGHGRPSATATKSWLENEASRSQAEDGVIGDPDGIPEPVLWLAGIF